MFTHQDCLLRNLTECGSGVALGVCHVELAEPIENSICVQSDSAAMCDQSNLFLEGSCINFVGEGNVEGICKWDQPDPVVCQAMEREGLPLEFFCNLVDGCSWG